MIKTTRYLLFMLLLLLFSCDKSSNSNLVEANNDSIAKYLKLASNDSLTFSERDKYNHKAFSLIDLGRNDSVVRWYLSKLSYNCSILKKGDDFIKISKFYYNKSKETKDTINLARYYRYKASYHKNITKLYDSAFCYYIKAEKFYKRTNDYRGLARVYFYKGLIQFKFDDYLGSELSNNLAYNLIKNRKTDRFTYDVLNQLGNIANNLRHYNQAIKFHNEALKIAVDLNLSPKLYNYDFINSSLNNIGNTYKEQKKYRKAIYYFEKALSNKKDVKVDILIYAYLYNNSGYSKMQLNEYTQLPILFEKAIKIYDSLGVINECSLSNVFLSDYYYRQKDTINAIKYSERALQLAKKAKAPYYYLIALSNAGYVNKNKASKYIKKYHEMNDSIQFEQRKTRNQFYKIQLETDEIIQEKETAIKQKWVLTSIISSVLLIVILLFVIHRQRAKQKELQLLQIQQKGNEEIYHLMLNQQAKVEEARQIEKKRIALELHDGIMNKLASTRLNLFVLSKKNDSETINKCLAYIEDIHHIENEIRNVSHDLNQDIFIEKDSFNTLLKQFLAEQNSHLKTNYELQLDKNINWETIASEIKMHLYRIIQEATRNSNKHAKATKVIICFTIDDNQLCLSVTDNGIGFDSEKTKGGIGLLNMQQRIQSINGTLSIESKAKKGTAIYIKIPL